MRGMQSFQLVRLNSQAKCIRLDTETRTKPEAPVRTLALFALNFFHCCLGRYRSGSVPPLNLLEPGETSIKNRKPALRNFDKAKELKDSMPLNHQRWLVK